MTETTVFVIIGVASVLILGYTALTVYLWLNNVLRDGAALLMVLAPLILVWVALAVMVIL